VKSAFDGTLNLMAVGQKRGSGYRHPIAAHLDRFASRHPYLICAAKGLLWIVKESDDHARSLVKIALGGFDQFSD